MKILNSQIEDTVSLIAGKEALPIYNSLKGKENVNEFDLVEKLELNINKIRNILYKLDNHGLLTSKRKKDRRKGWYIYFWTLDSDKLNRLVIKIKQDRLRFLQKKLTEEQNDEFYVCDTSRLRFNTEQALDYGYMCPDCGQVMELEDSTKIHNRIKKEINSLTKEIMEATKTPNIVKTNGVIKPTTVKKVLKKKVVKKTSKKVIKKKVKKKVKKRVTKKK